MCYLSFELAHFCTRFANERGHLGTRSSSFLWKCDKICREKLFVRGEVISGFSRRTRDETRSLHPPSRPPRTLKTILSFVRTNHDAHHIAHVKASHRSKSLFFCSSGTENGLRDDTVTNASRYLGVVRARHDEPSARSPSFAQLEIPGRLEAVRCSC